MACHCSISLPCFGRFDPFDLGKRASMVSLSRFGKFRPLVDFILKQCST
jgi:hypothetical protein